MTETQAVEMLAQLAVIMALLRVLVLIGGLVFGGLVAVGYLLGRR